jgi:serine O-acetyltransferase
MNMLNELKADAARYPEPWYLEPGFWATATYRLGRWARAQPRMLRWLTLSPQKLLNQYFHIVYQVDISPAADIGPGFALIHPRNILVGGCRIGSNCLLFQEVTLGMNANSSAFPVLGDNVDIYAGARVIGGIKVGNDVKIGANCVVMQSVADGCTVVVAKNRVISRQLVDAFGPRRRATAGPEASQTPAAVNPLAEAPPEAAANEPVEPISVVAERASITRDPVHAARASDHPSSFDSRVPGRSRSESSVENRVVPRESAEAIERAQEEVPETASAH